MALTEEIQGNEIMPMAGMHTVVMQKQVPTLQVSEDGATVSWYIYICFLYSTDQPAEENEGHWCNYPGRKAFWQPRIRQVLQSSLQWWGEELENIQSQGQRWGYGETHVGTQTQPCTHTPTLSYTGKVTHMHTQQGETVQSIKDSVEDVMRWLFN